MYNTTLRSATYFSSRTNKRAEISDAICDGSWDGYNNILVQKKVFNSKFIISRVKEIIRNQ